MKKKLLFFLLTVVCTLLCAPPNAHAWEFDRVGDPIKIGVLPSSANVPGGEFFLDFDSTTKTWSKEFTPTATSNGQIWFCIKCYFNGGSKQYSFNNGNSTIGSWYYINVDWNFESKYFWQKGITANKSYRFELQPCGSSADDNGNAKNFKWRIVEANVATPTFSPGAGTVDPNTEITISCATSDATIYYTIDGSDPSSSSTRKTYSASNKPKITSSCTVKAIAVKSGMTNSTVASASYAINYQWDFSGYTLPKAICVNFDQHWNSDVDLTYADGIWSAEFTPTSVSTDGIGGYVNFWIKPSPDGTTYPVAYGADNGQPSTNGEWTTNTLTKTSHFYQGGLVANTRYLFELTAADGNTEHFKWRITEVVEQKQYNVTVDLSQMGSGKWDASKVTAYIWQDDDTKYSDWGNALKPASINGDKVTFSFDWDKTPKFVIFKVADSGYENQTVNLTFTNNRTYILKSQVSSGDDANKWQTDAGQPVAAYNLPYGPNDFTEAKYFLVGSRMGMWRLQPEWELIKQADGSYKIDGGRYMFHGHFAVAKVQDFASYSKHQYTILYTKTNTSITRANKSISNLTLTADKKEKNPVYYNAAEGTGASNKALSFRYIGTGDDFNNAGNDKGTWCKEITFKDGTISFDIDDSDPNMASERVFTLVGENIYHNDYASGTDINGYTTPRGQTGWQESWIQYGPNGRPYFDAHHEYLYHTAYVPSILNSTSVNFQIDVNGKNFDYSSKAVTFVEKEHLTNLSTDKYRELYDYFIQHPEAVTSGATVQGGNEADGTAFNFTLGTLPEFVSENAKWQVYVVRDAWVKGQFKIWNGWGGNSINNEGMGGTDTGARWNTLNGGPVNTTGVTTQESQPTDVILTDVNAGTEAQGMNKVYMNQGTGSNWKTENGELQYYNRIILLYNTAATDRLANSFVLFIQDDTAPVIKAFLEGADNNKGYVEWNLQNVKTGSEAVITGYTITRYRMTDEGNINPAVVTTVSGIETPVSEFEAVRTEHDPDELNPGQYQYHIEVTYVNGTETGTREANSNRIRVLGADIYPEVRVEQLVSLTAQGCTSDVLAALGETAYRPGQMYLTYRNDSPTADYYLLTTTQSDNISRVQQIVQIDTEKARAILSDPNNYVWCARFYVRALDYTQYKHYYERQGLTCSEPQITITDQAAVEAIEDQDWTAQNGYTGKNIPTQQYQVKLTSGAVNTYIGAFIDRSGLLYAGEMRADMSYTFNTGSEDKPVEHNHTVNFTPVVANPYDLSAKFESRIVEFGTPIRDYVIETYGEDNVKGVGDFTANITFRTTPSSASAPENLKTIDVVAKENDIPGERHLDCVISFLRPNLSNNILSNYNIYYTIKVTSKEEEGLTEQDKLNYQPVEISGQYYDAEQTSDINPTTGSGSKRPYQVKITDVHPSGKIYPHFEITGVEYKRIHGTTVTEHTLATNHSYGPLVLDAKNKPEHETTVGEFALGWNEGRDEDGNIDASRNRWLLYGHKDLKHSATPDIAISGYPSSRLFLLEISDNVSGTVNYDYSPILWKHEHDVSEADGTLHIETVPFLIGSLPKNNDNITPSVTATPLYLFHRDPESQGVTGTNVINLNPVPSSASSVKRRAASATINPDKLTVTKDENDIVTGASYDATAAEYFLVTKSVPVTVAPEDAPVMTGIEDIVDDANAEAVYYNLQGIRVANPEHGKVYIRVSGRTAEKVVY